MPFTAEAVIGAPLGICFDMADTLLDGAKQTDFCDPGLWFLLRRGCLFLPFQEVAFLLWNSGPKGSTDIQFVPLAF